MRVEVTPASGAEQPTIAGLFQLYTHDFSEFEPSGSERFAIDDRGGFASYPQLDSYWREPNRRPFMIRAGGERAGFALVNAETQSGLAADFNMAELFVSRKFRGQGFAAEAVRLICSTYPGVWEVAVAARNAPALRFWPRAIAEAGARDVEVVQGDGERWTGPIWRFRSEGAGAR